MIPKGLPGTAGGSWAGSCTFPWDRSPSLMRCPMVRRFFAVSLTLFALGAVAAAAAPPTAKGAGADRLDQEIDRLAAQIEPEVIACRRQIHEHPELSNREVQTGKLVAERLGKLGIAVKTGGAHTGGVRV